LLDREEEKKRIGLEMTGEIKKRTGEEMTGEKRR